jgi:hypothetical protein
VLDGVKSPNKMWLFPEFISEFGVEGLENLYCWTKDDESSNEFTSDSLWDAAEEDDNENKFGL